MAASDKFAIGEGAPAQRSTREKLVDAAIAEFNERGFDGTDTNRIARRAGFAPQTFYRWFADKTEIFIVVYRAWEEDGKAQLGALAADHADGRAMAEAAIAIHKSHLIFRRSLRRLSAEDDQIRAARAESRLRQIEMIRDWRGGLLSTEDVACALFQLERLCDALAEGEFTDMRLAETSARRQVGELLSWLRTGAFEEQGSAQRADAG